MADISDAVSLGFGSWGSVNLLPTLGFGIAISSEGSCSDFPPQMVLVTADWKLGRWQASATRDMQVGSDATTGTAIPDWTYSTGFAKSGNPAVVKGLLVDASGPVTATVAKTTDGDTPSEARDLHISPRDGQDEVWVPGAPDMRGKKLRVQFRGAYNREVRRALWQRQGVDGKGG